VIDILGDKDESRVGKILSEKITIKIIIIVLTLILMIP